LDVLTGRDFSHRKALLLERLRHLAAIFAIDVCAFAILATHYHLVLRTRPEVVALWTDLEVARRWLTLFPRGGKKRGRSEGPREEEIVALADQKGRIGELRRRLSSLSWLMGRLNEYVARAANKEDEVKGRFWESRFKCQVLLDEAAIAGCMVYVDLNPMRAGLAEALEESDFTSIQERIRNWQGEKLMGASGEGVFDRQGDRVKGEGGGGMGDGDQGGESTGGNCLGGGRGAGIWLCRIESDSEGRGILPMTAAEYMELVDRSGRMIRPGKRGVTDGDLAPILQRIGANPVGWCDTVRDFGSRFQLAAGSVTSLRRFAKRLGRCWLKGVSRARVSFASASPQLA
jgi:hypothetical protein